jgi:hypothetical protein
MWNTFSNIFLLVMFFSFASCESNEKNITKDKTILGLDSLIFIDTIKNNNINIDSNLINENENIKSFSSLFNKFSKKAVVFNIRSDRDTVLTCKEGTVLVVKANSFVNAKNQETVTGDVIVKVKEYYTNSDILFENLTTTSNNSLIETAGMFYISVKSTSSNDSCTLAKGKEIVIAVNSSNVKHVSDMQVFNGDRKDAEINWTPKSSPNYASNWNYSNGFKSSDYRFRQIVIARKDENRKLLKPTLIKSNSQDLNISIDLPLQFLYHNLKEINSCYGYIDTLGVLNNLILNKENHYFKLKTKFKINRFKNYKVSVPVKYAYNIKIVNYPFFEKMLKLGKSDYDTLLPVVLTLIPRFSISNENLEYRDEVNKLKSINVNEMFLNEERLKALFNDIKLFEKQRTDWIQTKEGKLFATDNYLLINTSQLGWINCDRFLQEQSQRTDFVLKTDGTIRSHMFFHSYRSILTGNLGVFNDVPIGERVTIVAFKVKSDGGIMFAMKDTKISKNRIEDLDFESIDLINLQKRLKKLNRI